MQSSEKDPPKVRKGDRESQVAGKSKRDTSEGSQNVADDTIFIRNLSFDTEEDNLKAFIEENFGPTIYCLVCRDKETDESKGTAFAKFKDPENCAKCLREFKDRDLQTKFHLDGRNLIVLPALSREKVKDVKNKTEEKKDKRNLALSKEGYISPQSDEAKEMSKNDLEKRKVLNARNKELLKNLHNFVSDVRLCVHNLPASVDDVRLRHIFFESIKSDHPECKIMECRVMRNKKGGGQLGTSKGFGFVAFSKHEHALAALRCINNNPNIFTRDRRPIVEFSIENLVALNKKKTRLVNSQRKNQKNDEPVKQIDKGPTTKKVKSKKGTRKMNKKKSTVTIKNMDLSEGDNLLKKINKLKNKFVS